MASPSSRSRKRIKTTRPIHLAVALLLIGSPASVQALDARWGHTMALLSSPAALLISSGKTTSPDGQTYSSSPTSSTFSLLPLTSSFSLTTSSSLSSTSSPILTESATGAAPPYAWGNMEILSNGELLSLGGDGSPGTSIQTGEDSAWLMGSNRLSFTQQESGWGGEPMRRVGAASCTIGKTTYITGGMKGDGSNLGFLTTYSFSSTTSTFTLLPSTLPLDLVQPTLHCLPNSTLLLLGGYSYTTSSLPSLGTAYTLDTTNSNAEWTTVKLGGDSVPEGRRAHLGTTFGSENGIFVQGGGKGVNGLTEVLNDAWVLDLAAGAWIAVDPTGTGPGARLGHQGVAIGASQVLFFGGYQTSSAADANLYLYDLGTNSFLDTFTPPSTWSDTSSSPSTTAGSGTDASSSSQTVVVVPVVYTSTQIILSLIPTATTIDSTGATKTDFLTSTIFSDVLQTSSKLQSASGAQRTPAATGTSGSTESYVRFDPATYTGIIPGLATATGTSRSTATSKSSAGGGTGSSSDNTAVPLSTTSKLAIGFGVAVGSLALAAAATGLVLLRRRNARNYEGGWAVGEKRGRGDGEGRGLVREEDDGEGGGWLDGREKKRMKFGAGLGAIAAGIFAGGAEKVRQARVDMLGDEDTRRFETYPPPRSPSLGEDGEERPSRVGEHGGWAGMGIWNRSSSFVGSLVARRDASGGSGGVGRDWVGLDGGDGDLGGGIMHDEDEEEGLLDINGRGANGGESPLIDDPFSDDNTFRSPPAVAAAPLQPFLATKLNAPKTALPRSTAMTSFYPGTNHPITSSNLLPSDSSNSDDSHSYPHSSSSNDHSSSSNPQTPYSATRGDEYLSTAQLSRSESLLSPGGWRRVLGLRSKSPPPLTGLPSVAAMGAKMYALRDPSTPPTLDSLEENGGDWLTGFKGGLGRGREGHQQDRSLSSVRSARTATSEQIERMEHMDVIQRNRTASGSTSAPSLSNSTPRETPKLGSEGQNFNFNRYPSSSSSLRQSSSPEETQNPFDDQPPSSPTTPDLIALSPPGESSPWERSANTTPSSRTLPIPPPTKASISALNVPLSSPSSSSPSFNSTSSASTAYSPTLPAATRRSVRDTVAAFEQQSTPPLNIIKKEKHKKVGGTNFVAVPRAKLGIANPDGRDY